MKKFPRLLTVLVIAVLAMTACAGDGGDGQTTPGADMTAVPTMGDIGSVPGEEGTEEVMPTEPAATEPVETEAVATDAVETEAPDAAATPTLGSDTGSTGDDTGIPNTGAEGQFVLLSDVLMMSVEGQDGAQIGNVQGVVINRQSVVTTGTDNMDSGADTGGTDAGAGAMDSTPTADAGAGSGTGTDAGTAIVTSELDGNASVEYILVSLSGGNAGNSGNAGGASAQETPTTDAGAGADAGGSASGQTGSQNTVLVPWQAFDVSGMAGGMNDDADSDTGSDAGGMEDAGETETPEADAGADAGAGADMQATPTLAGGGGAGDSGDSGSTGSNDSGAEPMDGGDKALVLNVDQAVLSGAPAFDEAGFDGSVGGEVVSYWGGQVAGIPTTGVDDGAGQGEYVLVRGQIGSVSVNGSDGQALGQVRDFVVDAESGELLYAVLGGGSAFGSDLYVVPFDRLTWQSTEGEGQSLGTFETDLAEDAFTGAPSFSDASELEGGDWSSDVDSYWDSQ